ncbi:hypothetical protein C8A05DRAFT_47009 [Staphylotrichum tortipilum]|uniref:Uncharacterized protein n=1 Tax=Staphylotrichum tortipilum TaxID=2831512 RepID=A0AAN6MD91_9PEZI|nr:hypothetical protein C8A05DRAFT_47009 [Staphylotrichum longicolle]
MDKPSDDDTLVPGLTDHPTLTRDAASQEAAAPIETPNPAAGTTAADDDNNDEDRPVRVLVQTRTHLVPGDKSDQWRGVKMQDLICQQVWKRDFDKFRERAWNYHCHWAIDNVECWFLVDHHGPDPTLPPDPPVIWYRWTGTEFVMVHDPLPRRVRREFRHYPFEKSPHLHKPPPPPGPGPRRTFGSRAEEIRFQRGKLLSTLRHNDYLTDALVRFVRENPEAADWVRVRVPPEVWPRLDDPYEPIVLSENARAASKGH